MGVVALFAQRSQAQVTATGTMVNYLFLCLQYSATDTKEYFTGSHQSHDCHFRHRDQPDFLLPLTFAQQHPGLLPVCSS
jgi:hypothetical protein